MKLLLLLVVVAFVVVAHVAKCVVKSKTWSILPWRKKLKAMIEFVVAALDIV
jgi:hypothetical protein